jgi:glycosyltransferase involved in cell wall biosynthesis
MAINYVAPLNTLGFGIFSIIYYKILKDRGHQINWQVIGHPHPADIQSVCDAFDIKDTELDKDCTRALEKGCPSLTIWHPHQINIHTEELEGRRVGLTHFETTGLMPIEAEQMEKMNHMLVCSAWGRDVMHNNGLTRSSAIPGVCAPMMMNNMEPTDATARLMEYLNNNYFTIASAGKFETRKAQYKQLEALLHTEETGLCLVGLWNNVFTGGLQEPITHLTNTGWKQIGQIYPSGGSISTLWEHPTKAGNVVALVPFKQRMADLHYVFSNSKVFLSSSSGEGWDQPLVEAMALSCPCIATYNTAHTAYLSTDNAILLDCERLNAYDGVWFKGNRGDWFPTTNVLIKEAIDEAIGSPSEYLAGYGSQARKDILSICNSDVIGKKLEEVLEVS